MKTSSIGAIVLKYWWVAYFIICLAIGFQISGGMVNAPTTPRPETGNVVPYNNHGKTVYITKREDQWLTWGPLVGISVVVLVTVIRRRKGKS